MTKQDSRAAFEQWAKSIGYSIRRGPKSGHYVDSDTFRTWGSWQAAIAYATAQQAEREKRLATWMSEKTGAWLSDDNIAAELAAFNAHEHG